MAQMETVGANIERVLDAEDWAGARRLVRKALASSPEDHWLWSRLGLTYYEERKYEDALKHEQRALALQPSCPLAIWGLAGTRHMLGQTDQAVLLYRRLIRRGSLRIAYGPCGEGLRWARGLVADCWYRLGEIHEAQGHRTRAAKAYREHLASRRGGASIYDGGAVRARLRSLKGSKQETEAPRGVKARQSIRGRRGRSD
jgi:tetratricopeptide (TPR) repeat protein